LKTQLQVERLNKAYGDRKVLQDISFEVEKGEIFTLLGPSGAGKSTVLNCLNGMTSADSGRIVLNGREITHTPLQHRNVATVFQNFKLFGMSVAQNVVYPLQAKKVRSLWDAARQLFKGTDTEIKDEVARMLSLVKLSAHAAKYPQQLSGGEQQRVALARALICRPELLCLDEPLASLDQHLKYELLEEMSAIQRRFEQTFVYITHDQHEAFSLSDRIAVMYEGRILQIGTPTELYRAPQSDFVAGFIGEYNLFEPETAGLLTGKTAQAGQVLGILPEHFTLYMDKPEDRSCLSGKVLSGHLAKGFARFRIALEQGETVKVTSTRFSDLEHFQPEQPVYLAYNPEHILFLHKIINN
jgi:ABC-type Fe3+/spermidine/putrescine transport system ATPase subunit